MKNIARQALLRQAFLFITNHQEVKKILKHIEAECPHRRTGPEEPKGLHLSLLSCAMSWKTPMTGETFRQMKLIL